jgi:hypothetical protein
MKIVKNSLERIAQTLPDLSHEEWLVVEECLEECFELGRAWDTIPILVKEAKPPPVVEERKQPLRTSKKS